jgi:hypothetical protein
MVSVTSVCQMTYQNLYFKEYFYYIRSYPDDGFLDNETLYITSSNLMKNLAEQGLLLFLKRVTITNKPLVELGQTYFSFC